MQQSWKTAVIISAGVAVFFYATQIRGEDPSLIEAVSMTLFMFSIAFLTMRITGRAVDAGLRKWGPKPPPRPEPRSAIVPPTSERIDHNRRRRERRRRERRR
ncbi:MAG: hypothetical protein DWG83_01505 [Chloroflexi bacterium]|nr:hypothetical protein [Chloroflexota bacterium]MQC19232.1 hypothetical protein [Chloroflexota bacterium]